MNELKPKSLSEFVKVIEDLQANSDGPLWYRGSSKANHPLLPSLYRKRVRPVGPADASSLELGLVTRFRERSIPYQTRPLGSDELETLFLMQHFGVPTRLLDWTENPFTGLFFALRNAAFRPGKGNNLIFNDRAAVWVLDPTKWNRGALSQRSYGGGALNPSHEVLAAYRLIGRIDELAPRPIALYGAHNSPRIVAQQGAFVLFGSDVRPMEIVARSQEFESTCLTKIVINPSVVGRMRESLWRHGHTDATLFPDLEGLARDLRRTYGFDV